MIEEKRRQAAAAAPPPPPPKPAKAVAANTETATDEPKPSETEAAPAATAIELEPGSPEALAQEATQQGAFDPETGEINWDCPCLGGMADGPCGEEFKAAFSCFVYSKEEPKGMDCIEKFQYVLWRTRVDSGIMADVSQTHAGLLPEIPGGVRLRADRRR